MRWLGGHSRHPAIQKVCKDGVFKREYLVKHSKCSSHICYSYYTLETLFATLNLNLSLSEDQASAT